MMSAGRLMSWRAVLGIMWMAIVFAGPYGIRPGVAQPSPMPAEIVELARALKNSPDLIYEYVHNNIETLPQYGSLKGPLGALLDGKGTAFDQAELMVALLQQAGLTASYQIGAIELTVNQLTNWLGTDTSVGSVNFVLGSGGFPATIFVNSNNVVTRAQIGWAWVVVNIGGTNFVFDPSTKTYNRSTGIGTANIAAALGYTQSSFITNAEQGATITPTSIAGVNRANIRSNLTTYANNLFQFIRSNNPAAATADIIGGKSIVPLTLGTQQRQTSLSYAVAGTVQNQPTIPSAFRTILTLTLGSNDQNNTFTPLSSAITFNTSDIYGHRIVASFNSSLTPSLLFDGVTQVTASGALPSGRQLTVRTSISHPYPDPFANVTDSDQVRVTPLANAIYLIGTGWGHVGRGMIEKHRKLLQQNIAQNPGNPTAEPVLGESLAMLGYTWLAERSQQQLQIVDQLAGIVSAYHHAVGVVGMKAIGSSTGPYVDLPINRFTNIQRVARPNSSGSTPVESSAFFSKAIFASIAESGILEQTQPGATFVSTVKLIDTTIQSSGTIFDINNGAIAGDDCAFYSSAGGIRSQLQNYQASDLRTIDGLVGYVPGTGCKAITDPTNPNRRVIAPANGAINVMQYTGAGYFQISQDGNSIGGIITGGLSGGLPATPVPPAEVVDNTPASVVPAPVQSPVITNPQGPSGNAGGIYGVTLTSRDPINLVTGDYLVSTTDLTVGSQGMPYGLSFQRYYDSGTRFQNGPLGFGWTHNFAVTALPDSDAFEGMGVNSPINGAAAIAATFVTQDILNTGTTTPKPLDRVVIASVVQRWLMDQLTTNIVAVTQPGYLEHFTKLSDGSYNPPLGSATTLTLNNGVYTYVTKNSVTLSFNSTGNLATWSNPAGATMTLNYSGSPPILASLSNNLGRALTFTYSSISLAQVSDSIGRSVSYAYDAAGNLARFIDTLGQTTTYAYDLPGRLTQIFYPSASGTPFVNNTYDSLGRVKTQANANNATWQYFLAGSRSEEGDPLGTQHVIYTTPRGKTRIDIQDLQGLNQVTTNTYDALDRLTSTTLPEGNSLGYIYDANNNVLTVTATPKPGSPLSPLVTAYSYDSTFNKPTSVTDPRGLVTTMSYEGGTGNLLRTVLDAGNAPHFNATSTFTYDSFGQQLTATDPWAWSRSSAMTASGV